ncbi:ABC transporter ATP-binding protein [Roseovarius sp.]|uniref:ABC transporter ATP-binding protein n=2 Tax=Roseovarius sp. TaxID=1486281 RepID=UPI00355A0CE2
MLFRSVGATGSGKTTILSLLSRLYDTQGGEIRIGDTPIDRLKVGSLRGAFSVVAQDIVIFNASIWDNIRYVRPDATEAEVWQAAEDADIAELIRRRGNTPVGPKGAQLSGGQKQRIAIARAFLRDAPILLLDEATSALDQATEERIKAALTRLTKGKTTIVVAHRLSSISDADRIFVLEGGRLVEDGQHDELLAENGLYAQLYKAQKRGYDGR